MKRYLLVVTECGYGKRLPMEGIRRRHRNRKGVAISSAPIATAIVLDGTGGDLLLATALGKIERVAIRDIPTRRREVTSKGRLSKGAKLITLAAGDRVAAASIHVDETRPETAATGMEPLPWPWGRAGLHEGEKYGQTVVFHRARALAEIEPGGWLAVSRDEWAATEIHKASTYWCWHCGEQREDPESVYACVNAHVAEIAKPMAA